MCLCVWQQMMTSSRRRWPVSTLRWRFPSPSVNSSSWVLNGRTSGSTTSTAPALRERTSSPFTSTTPRDTAAPSYRSVYLYPYSFFLHKCRLFWLLCSLARSPFLRCCFASPTWSLNVLAPFMTTSQPFPFQTLPLIIKSKISDCF